MDDRIALPPPVQETGNNCDSPVNGIREPCRTPTPDTGRRGPILRFIQQFGPGRPWSRMCSLPSSAMVPHLLLFLLSASTVFRIAESCSSRSTPKPRPTSATMRPNITFQTYACPEAYAKWYCLNGATCFAVKIRDSILYNCECADGYMGQRCEFKDLDGSYLPSREKVMIERASIAGGVTIAVLLVVLISLTFYIHMRRRRKYSAYYPEQEKCSRLVQPHRPPTAPDLLGKKSRLFYSSSQRPCVATISQTPYFKHFQYQWRTTFLPHFAFSCFSDQTKRLPLPHLREEPWNVLHEIEILKLLFETKQHVPSGTEENSLRTTCHCVEYLLLRYRMKQDHCNEMSSTSRVNNLRLSMLRIKTVDYFTSRLLHVEWKFIVQEKKKILHLCVVQYCHISIHPEASVIHELCKRAINLTWKICAFHIHPRRYMTNNKHLNFLDFLYEPTLKRFLFEVPKFLKIIHV